MFATTFLGHQGWLFQSERACLLVDPLLCEEFGLAHALDYRVYPPRVLKPENFPKIDVVVLTHEHDDHFDIPSLALLDRNIPILLSTRSSMAAYNILDKMGFKVAQLVPGVAYQFADLEILTFSGDHVNMSNGDEWDTLPFLIRHSEGAGSFFSMVDITLTPGHIEMARSCVSQPGLVGWTNNALDWSHMAHYLTERTEGTEQAIIRMRAGHTLIGKHWGTPAAMLMCAGGFSFYGDRAWLNKRVFCVDNERVCKKMAALYPTQHFYATRPGQTFYMEGNALKKVEKETPFLSTPPPPSWPLRGKNPTKETPDYAPATGSRELGEGQLEKLRDRLTEFAQILVGGTLFKNLFSLMGVEASGLLPTFAFVLRNGAERCAMVFEYDPSACTFSPGRTEDPQRQYLAGMECWATDLLAVLSGELGVIALIFGRATLWNAASEHFNFVIFDELHRVSHPLRRPAEYLRIYERLLQKNADVVPRIMPR